MFNNCFDVGLIIFFMIVVVVLVLFLIKIVLVVLKEDKLMVKEMLYELMFENLDVIEIQVKGVY